jgi:hypothetical protein
MHGVFSSRIHRIRLDRTFLGRENYYAFTLSHKRRSSSGLDTHALTGQHVFSTQAPGLIKRLRNAKRSHKLKAGCRNGIAQENSDLIEHAKLYI